MSIDLSQSLPPTMLSPFCLVDNCAHAGHGETRGTASSIHGHVSLDEDRRRVDWPSLGTSMSKQDNNAPSLIHHTMQLPSLCAFLSIPNSTPPCSMTSSTQMLGFSRPEGSFQRTVMCCQRGMQSSAPVLHLNPSTLSAVSIFWWGTLTQPSCSDMPARLLPPLPLGHSHITGQNGRLRRPSLTTLLFWCLSRTRTSTLSNQAGLFCSELHRLKPKHHAWSCVIHWLTPVSRRMSWDPPPPHKHQTPPSRPRVRG
ncbi:hypothetical protein CDEST_12552 [Colletotrichum destructivum]|uniref:Uncharacterized protein n=1 Tax=Colletotrichum destructivum TaxID=34406 RepID=A0AAX4IW90_9PEZI|nr:hypothetical protein CDEST_12552 [Colletotrichum destructivum]